MMKTPASRRIDVDPKNIASPDSIVTTDTYIGFRTYLYGPRTTSRLGGSIGANVPWPIEKKSQMHQSNPAAPISIKGEPRYRSGLFPKPEARRDEVSQ